MNEKYIKIKTEGVFDVQQTAKEFNITTSDLISFHNQHCKLHELLPLSLPKYVEYIYLPPKNFSSNFIDQIQNTPYKNEDFLLDMEEKLWQYAFKNGVPHYLHWNSTYGESGMDIAVQKNYPNKVNGIRKRHTR